VNAPPDVSVVMVVRDEPPARVHRVVEALRGQEPLGTPFVIELLIAGPPTEVARYEGAGCGGRLAAVRAVGNPGGGRSAGLNRATAAARATTIVRVDARSRVPQDYVARCLARLESDPAVGVVGGVQWPEPVGTSVAGRGAARALRNRWLLGNPAYRRPGAGGAVDTVYLGAFRRAELVALGGWDEGLDANEDFDLCARYRAAGQRVWLEEDLLVGYEPRVGARALFRQYEAFGRSKVRFWRRTGRRPNARQSVALGTAGVATLAAMGSLGRTRRVTGLLATGVVALGLLDHLADPHEPDARVRAHAWVDGLAMTGGWLAGVARGFLGP